MEMRRRLVGRWRLRAPLLVGLGGLLLGVGVQSVSVNAGECDTWRTLHPEWDFCSDFEAGWPSDWDVTSNPSLLYVSTTMPFEGTRSLEWSYPANESGFTYTFLKKPYTDLYLRFYLRLSDNWFFDNCHDGTGTPTACHTKGPLVRGDKWRGFYNMQDIYGLNQETMYGGPMKESNWEDHVYIQNLGTPVTWQNSRWYCLEVHHQLNTPGQANGVFETWIDGTLKAQYTNREFLGSSPTDPAPSDATLDYLFWSGSKYPSRGSPPPEYRWYDNVIASSQRIGCLGTPPADTTAPSTPTNLTATAVSASQINLSWTASTDNVGVTGYQLERCQGSSCTSFVQIATPSATSHNDTGLTANTTYRYRVRATDAAGLLSGYSAMVSATTRGDLDGNGKVDLDDLRRMIYMLVGTVPQDLTKADLDGDGQLLLVDLQLLVKILVGIP